MTWSARSSTDGWIVKPIALAVLRLMTNSNLVGCSTGKSAGLAPFRTLSTYQVERRTSSTRFGPYDMRPPARANSRKNEMDGSLLLNANSATRAERKKITGSVKARMAEPDCRQAHSEPDLR